MSTKKMTNEKRHHDYSIKEIEVENREGIKKAFHLKLIHNDVTESCNCRCVSHCTCDCDKCIIGGNI